MATNWDLVTTKGEARFYFGTGPDLVRNVLGQPKRESTTRSGQLELEYEGLIFRYDKVQGSLCEVTLVPAQNVEWRIDGQTVVWQIGFMRQACSQVGRAEQWVGFVILRDLGIAFSGFDPEDEGQMAVTMFPCGHWDEFASHFKPYMFRRSVTTDHPG